MKRDIAAWQHLLIAAVFFILDVTALPGIGPHSQQPLGSSFEHGFGTTESFGRVMCLFLPPHTESVNGVYREDGFSNYERTGFKTLLRIPMRVVFPRTVSTIRAYQLPE